MRKFLKALSSDRGSAESAMVIIPLLLLFLIGIEISLAVHSRNSARISIQDSASKRAISGEFIDSDQFIHIDSSGDGQNLDLLVTHRQESLQNLFPGLLGSITSGRKIDLQGFAIVENQR